jgi:hypothetical protein
MNIVARAAVLGLAGLTAFGAAGCNRGGSGGATTIIQQAPGGAGSVGTSTIASPSVIQINDSTKLCALLRGKGQIIIKAIDDFWLSPGGFTLNWPDPKVSSSADNAIQVVGKEAPLIEGAIGPNAPEDVASAMKNFVKVSKDFAEAISRTASTDELNSLNRDFTDAVNKNKEVCHF